jgi:asparagine synthase (glutamine-hydrolysing)
MCGIAGYHGTGEIPRERIDRCLSLMRRRGPDATGTYRHRTRAGRNVVLLHSRLSIIDLDPRANQPFRHGDKVLACNGELYNYVELRGGLGPLATASDTEVLIRVLDRDGAAALADCEGMWAFAFYDEGAEELTLSRDRFGEKPLYVLRDATGLYFGSEVKFVAALAGRWPEIELDHLFRYMVNGYKALYKTEAGFFRDLREVAPGTCLMLDPAGEERVRRYWTPPVDVTDDSLGYGDSVALVRDALIRSVELRLRADVPLAFCLSGGVDSNALIAIAKRRFGYDVHGFTIMNTDSRYEERDMVEHAVRHLDLRHTTIPVESDRFLERLRELVRQHDAPVYTITYYVQWRLMQAIADHGYRVSVSGTAADELFSGYYDHHNAYLQEAHGDPARYGEALRAWETHVRPHVRNPFLSDPELFVRDPAERRHIYLNADEFAAFLRTGWDEPFAERDYRDGLLRNRMLNELFHESVPPILHEDDLNAMYFSIENRSPFLDSHLFETTQRIPTRHLMRNGRAKALLRDAVADIAPPQVIDNPRKTGFNAPILDLLDLGDPDVRGYLLDGGAIYDHVRKDKIEALIRRNELPNSESKFLFYFLNAKIFLEEFGRA